MKNGCAISRRRALALGACALAPLSLARAAFAAKQQPVVVELFTSQGCSSCPAADKLLGEIRNTPGVIAMSINVDYWDYLGWRDTLAEKSHSQRQYDYATARGDMDVYTPQIVVNGSDYCVGSDRSAVMAAISKAQQMPGSPVSLSLANEQDEIILTVSGENGAPGCTIWLMPIAPDITVKIERGENSGSDIVYHNVVRSIIPAGMWKGAATTIRLPKTGIMTPDCAACVALLQAGNVGPVRAVATWGKLSA